MKKLLFVCAIPAMVSLTGCGEGGSGTTDGTDTAATQNAAADFDGYVEYDLSEDATKAGSELNFALMVPNEDRANAVPKVTYSEGLMTTTLQVGRHYMIDIADSEPDMAQMKKDLEGDLAFENNIHEEGDNYIIYESKAPDMERSFFHFWMSKEIDGVNYTITDNKMGEFTKVHIENMVKSLNSMKTAEPAA